MYAPLQVSLTAVLDLDRAALRMDCGLVTLPTAAASLNRLARLCITGGVCSTDITAELHSDNEQLQPSSDYEQLHKHG